MNTRTPSHTVDRVVDSKLDTSTQQAHLPRGSKTIVVPFLKSTYPEIVQDGNKFKDYLGNSQEINYHFSPNFDAG